MVSDQMNFIHLSECALSEKRCEELISFFESNIDKARPGKAGVNDLPNLELIIGMNMTDALTGPVRDFIKEYPLFDTNLAKWNLDPCIHICKFEPGKSYERIHCENDGSKENQNRAFAWMIYLNDIQIGGETEFIYQKFKTTPKAGNLYIWPSGATHMHRGLVAPYQDKYFLTGWFNFQNN
tara:strand:+ start:91 stop:633 length:543 start_codon:yes stop_codon:yes gene_type:complete